MKAVGAERAPVEKAGGQGDAGQDRQQNGQGAQDDLEVVADYAGEEHGEPEEGQLAQADQQCHHGHLQTHAPQCAQAVVIVIPEKGEEQPHRSGAASFGTTAVAVK